MKCGGCGSYNTAQDGGLMQQPQERAAQPQEQQQQPQQQQQQQPEPEQEAQSQWWHIQVHPSPLD